MGTTPCFCSDWEPMSEVVLVALISSGSAVLAAVVTHLFAARATSKQAQVDAEREARIWRRDQEEVTRERTEKLVRELWSWTLQAQARMIDLLEDRAQDMKLPLPGHESSAAHAAAQAYAVSLLGMTEVQPTAKAFYIATATTEAFLQEGHDARELRVREWRDTFSALEAAVSKQVPSLRVELRPSTAK